MYSKVRMNSDTPCAVLSAALRMGYRGWHGELGVRVRAKLNTDLEDDMDRQGNNAQDRFGDR